MSARLCGARVLDDVRRGPGSAPAKPAAKSCLAAPKSALDSLKFGAKRSRFTIKKHHFTIRVVFTTEPQRKLFFDRGRIPKNSHVAHHTQRENDTTNGGLPPYVLSNIPFVCGVACVC